MTDFFKQSIEQSQKLLTAMQKDFNETVTFHNEMYTNLMKKLEERDKLIESLRAEIGKTKDKNKELEKINVEKAERIKEENLKRAISEERVDVWA